MKKAIYSVLVGNYEKVPSAPQFSGWEPFLFTDMEINAESGWNVIPIQTGTDPKLTSRHYKLLAHVYLEEYDLYCYFDANIVPIQPPPTHPFIIQHPRRKNITDEAVKVIEYGKEAKVKVGKQLTAYKRDGFKDDAGLYMNGYFVRPNSPEVNDFYEYWWKQLETYGYRDQLSFPYCMWKKNVTLPSYPLTRSRRYFRLNQHKHNEVKGFNVHYITPGRADKQYGKAVNEIVERLPDGDWICLRDIDTLVLNHEQLFRQVDEVIRQHGQDYQLMSCMTNDLGLHWQLVGGKINKSYNLVEHRTICDRLIKSEYSEVRDMQGKTVGGFFMLFSKEIWKQVGGLIPGVHDKYRFFDAIFSEDVMKAGGKIGVCTGIYVYHFCRYGKPRSNKDHLFK